MHNLKNWKQVALPDNMKGLPVDERGFPVPFIILKDAEGVYHFKVNDEHKRQACIFLGLCAICSLPLKDDMWMVGGPMSAFHPHGVYIDTALHHECMQYAMKVCPYLAIRKYRPGDPEMTVEKVATMDGTQVFVNPTVIAERPEVFAAAKVTGYSWMPVDEITNYVKPDRPYLDVELWDSGELVPWDSVELVINGRVLEWSDVCSKKVSQK